MAGEAHEVRGPAARRAAVVSVGEELLAGDIADTNAPYLAAQLRALGFRVRSFQVAGDEVAAIARALRQAAAAAEVVIASGGLGPTGDDLTRDGLAAAAGEPLVADPAALAMIEAFFARVGRQASASNALQARRPASAALIANPCGTAPGLAMRLDGARVFVLPGVPAELRAMLAESVLPEVLRLFGPGAPPARVRLHAHGPPESVAGERIAEFMGEGRAIQVGITVASGILTVSLTGPDASAASRLQVEALAAEVARRFGADLFGRDGQRLEEVVVARLAATGRGLALAESCTGGLMAKLITDVPGSSAVFREGIVSYANAAKVRLLGVSEATLAAHGAVSRAAALEMAAGAATRAGVQAALATTGVAGPGGGTADKPVGLVHVGLFLDGRTSHKELRLSGDREMIRLRAARAALDLLRRALG